MGFFSDFAAAWNEISDCTFNTLIVKSHAQSNKVAQEYKTMLTDPDFKNTAETKTILMASSSEARKAFGINIDAKPEETQPEAQPVNQPETKPEAQPEASN